MNMRRARYPRRFARVCTWGALLVLYLSIAGCGRTGVPAGADSTAVASAEQEADETIDYEVFLSGAITDTLRGNAVFNTVWNPHTGKKRLVIQLETGAGPGAGMYITQDDTTMPSTGTYTLVPQDDSTDVQEGRLAISYRQGMLRVLTSRAGSLTIEEVTDSIIAGRFEAEFWGQVVRVDRSPGVLPYRGPQAVDARGSFVAERGRIGYIVGIE